MRPAVLSALLAGLAHLSWACADDAGQPDGGGADAAPGDATETDAGCGPDSARVELRSEDGLSYTNPRFSPDGTEVAVLAWRGLAFDDIVITDRCGEEARKLGIRASAKAVSTWAPTWSPDGAQIYFVGSEDSVRRVSREGGTSEIVYPSISGPVLDLSRDGRRLLYAQGDFRILDLQTRTSTALGVYGTSPRFSPDGTRLAYTRDRRIEIMELSTRDTQVVLSFQSLVRLSVAWFSDGARLAITSEAGVEVVELTDPPTRRVVDDEPLARDVDVSRDDTAIGFGLNGRPSVRLIRGFD